MAKAAPTNKQTQSTQDPPARTSPAQIRAREVVASHRNLPNCKYVSIVKLRAQGLSNAAIGAKLAIHPNQVSARMPEAIDWILSGCPASNDRRTWGIYRGAGDKQESAPQPVAPPARKKAPSRTRAKSQAPVQGKRAAKAGPAAQADGASEEHRFSRLLGLMHLLSSRPATAETLGRLFKTTERTIQRDILLLRKLGFAVESKGRGKGLSIENAMALPEAVVERLVPEAAGHVAPPPPPPRPATKPPKAPAENTSRLW